MVFGLRDPGRTGGAGDSHMNDALGVHVRDEEREDWQKPEIVNLEEVAGPDGMVAQESAPGLAIAGRPRCSKVALNRPLADPKAELQELPPDALGAPKTILPRHSLDQRDRGFSDA
jgi:hypothetical protein